MIARRSIVRPTPYQWTPIAGLACMIRLKGSEARRLYVRNIEALGIKGKAHTGFYCLQKLKEA